MMQAAGAADQLSDKGLVATVLAPTNAAFQASQTKPSSAAAALPARACLFALAASGPAAEPQAAALIQVCICKHNPIRCPLPSQPSLCAHALQPVRQLIAPLCPLPLLAPQTLLANLGVTAQEALSPQFLPTVQAVSKAGFPHSHRRCPVLCAAQQFSSHPSCPVYYEVSGLGASP